MQGFRKKVYKHVFWQHFFLNWELAALIGFLSFIFHFLVFRKYIYSVFDPFFLNLIMGSMAHAVPIFLFARGLISSYYLSTFLLTQVAYISGFLLFKPIDLHKTRLFATGEILLSPTMKIMYYLAVVCLVFFQLTVYYVSGIPLLMYSRLEVFVSGSGYGILNRFLSICHPVVTIIVMYKLVAWFLGRLTITAFDKFAIFAVAVISVLSGSKATFLSFVFAAFFVCFFFQKFPAFNHEAAKKILRMQTVLFVLAVFTAFGVILIQSDGITNPIVGLLMRTVNTGDVYMLAYPDGVLEKMAPASPILATFQDFLGASRLYSWAELPQNLGQQLYQYVNKSERIAGPNSRHNVFGLHYYGPYFSVVLSFLLGCTCSFLRNRLFVLMRPNLLYLIIYSLMVSRSLELEGDTPMALANFNSTIFVLGVLYFISALLLKLLRVICHCSLNQTNGICGEGNT